ncbi:MAG: choice-of-anchor J domain-containing protein [Bacteroidota bacterium]|nr:choice-of-anchor J domain-containing protein [Bacteroidota bacterium]
MKLINQLFILTGLVLMATSCDYNELNFPGYKDAAIPTNVFAYEDTLLTTDYAVISKLGLAVAKNKADSAAAKSIASLCYFTAEAPASKYIPLWLASKYLYGDRKSSVMVTSSQYVYEEGEVMDVTEKYVLDSIWALYDAEILNEDFSKDMGDFTAVSLAGDQTWYWSSYSGDGFAKISGYKSSVNYENEDWLISPPINLSKRAAAELTFDQVNRYGPTVDTLGLQLWATDNYADGGAIDTTQWKRLSFANGYNSSAYTFTTSGPVSLNEWAGKSNVRIAFRYRSQSGISCSTWEIQNVLVLEP